MLALSRHRPGSVRILAYALCADRWEEHRQEYAGTALYLLVQAASGGKSKFPTPQDWMNPPERERNKQENAAVLMAVNEMFEIFGSKEGEANEAI